MKMKFLAVLFLVSPILVAQEITVFPSFWGESFYKDKEKITWKEFGMLMDATPEAQEYWQKSKKQMLGGLIAGAANRHAKPLQTVGDLWGFDRTYVELDGQKVIKEP